MIYARSQVGRGVQKISEFRPQNFNLKSFYDKNNFYKIGIPKNALEEVRVVESVRQAGDQNGRGKF